MFFALAYGIYLIIGCTRYHTFKLAAASIQSLDCNFMGVPVFVGISFILLEMLTCIKVRYKHSICTKAVTYTNYSIGVVIVITRLRDLYLIYKQDAWWWSIYKADTNWIGVLWTDLWLGDCVHQRHLVISCFYHRKEQANIVTVIAFKVQYCCYD